MDTLTNILDYSVYKEKYQQSVYKLFPSYTSTNALSSPEWRVISVFLNKSKIYTFKKKKYPVRWILGNK